MRPTSVISMIVALLLIAAGFVTCLIAENMAEADGELLFAETRADGLVNTIDLSDTSISKLELNVSDAKICIYGGSETSYMELVNFRENYYSFNASNRVVSLDEVPDVASMLKFWENGMSFKGIRYLLDFQKEEEPAGEKMINVYLGGENIDLKILEITGNACDVQLENLPYSADYTIAIKEGSLSTANCRNASSLTLSGTDLRADMRDSRFNTFTVSCSKLDFTGNLLYLPMTSIDCEVVHMDLIPTQSIGSQNYNLTLEVGSITVNGNNTGSSFLQNASSNNRFELFATSGEITLSDPPIQSNVWPPVAN
ncbi:MAG: hypothetical protein IKV57_04750 [Clostridia bacterium]|nr:hypothetical protein [Clostridia bacterium]